MRRLLSRLGGDGRVSPRGALNAENAIIGWLFWVGLPVSLRGEPFRDDRATPTKIAGQTCRSRPSELAASTDEGEPINWCWSGATCPTRSCF